MPSVRAPISPRDGVGPAWEIATLFPDQGNLTESDYLFLTAHARRLVEFSDGYIEVLPMPTTEHQEIVLFLVNLLRSFVIPRRLGRALMAPLRVRLREGRFREPDVVFMLEQNASRIAEQFWTGADLVIEVVSEDDSDRDLVEKRREYAEAGIAEYCIVEPKSKTVTVLKLSGTQYVVHGTFGSGARAESSLLQGFTADVDAIFAAGASHSD